jgi:hypothetical protein
MTPQLVIPPERPNDGPLIETQRVDVVHHYAERDSVVGDREKVTQADVREGRGRREEKCGTADTAEAEGGRARSRSLNRFGKGPMRLSAEGPMDLYRRQTA